MAMGYLDTFVTVAADCPATAGVAPSRPMSIAGFEHSLLIANPYQLTGEDLILAVHAQHKGVAEDDMAAFREALFSKPHPCLRASMLPKRYGWGAHYDARGRIALHGVETEVYLQLKSRRDLTIVPAMRNRR